LLLLLTQTRPHQSTLVNTANSGRIMPADNQKRRNIVIYTGHTRSIAPFAHRYKLMQQNHPAQPNTRLDFAMSAYLNIVAQYNFVFDYTVMPDVHTNHKQIVTANLRTLARVYARMNRYLFANYVIITYHKSTNLTIRAKIQYLRRPPYHAISK
jgi:hypothetical protein